MSMIQEYFAIEKKYQCIYGEKTFLLYQVGSFFEVYGIQEKHDKHCKLFSDMCNLNLSIKQNIKLSKTNDKLYMCGFQCYLLEKYIDRIQCHGYSAVVYEQEPEDPTKRSFSKIYSPGTSIIEQRTNLSNNISCVWIDKVHMTNQEHFVFGLSNINIYNGETNISEYIEQYFHNPTTYGCIEHFFQVYNPLEIIFIHNVEQEIMEGIIKYLALGNTRHYMIDLQETTHELSIQAKNCESQIYQNETMKKFYPGHNIESLMYNLYEKAMGIASFCFLVNFVEMHNTSLVKMLEIPIIDNKGHRLICANHSLKQLNFISSEKEEHNKRNFSFDQNLQKVDSVIGILNNCRTPMGKRFFNTILLNPISDIEKLTNIYDNISYINEKKYDFFQSLNKIKDIEKYTTKLKLFKLNPNEIYHIYNSIIIFEEILSEINSDNKARSIYHVEPFYKSYNNFKKYLQTTFDINNCQYILSLNFEKYENFNTKFINYESFPKLKKVIEDSMDCNQILESILNYFESLFPKKGKDLNSNYIKQQTHSNSELILLVTKKRSEVLKSQIKTILKNLKSTHISYTSKMNGAIKTYELKIDEIFFRDYNKTTVQIISPQIDIIRSTIFNNQNELHCILQECYHKIQKHIIHVYYETITHMIEFYKYLDLYDNYAQISKTYKLCKPKIKNKVNGSSFVEAKKMRHILIENIEKNEIYVSNDVCLGSKKSNLGMLLYGTNAVGKTSLIKSLGICVIMAQSGCFVPCESFVYYPYNYIFTRIIGNDNIFKGLSTFGVEMSELRVILNQCDQNSLILGDELCSGTEAESALAIFTASLERLTSKKSNFIFATHFHEMLQYEEIKTMDSIYVKHLRVKYDNEKQTLYYDRTLQDGNGESIYGLEVCKSLNIDAEFLDRAYQIRNKYCNNSNILQLKMSKYNKSKLKGQMCEFCKGAVSAEIHHMHYQKDANKDGMINGTFHKDHSANLACVCSKCHDKIHELGLIYERKRGLNGEYHLIIKQKN